MDPLDTLDESPNFPDTRDETPKPWGGVTELGTFDKSMARGIDTGQAMLYASVNAIGEVLGSEFIDKWGEEGAIEQLRQAAENPPKIRDWDDVESLANFGTYVQERLGEQIGQLVPVVAGGIIGGGARIAQATLGKALLRKMGAKSASQAMKQVRSRAAKVGGGAVIYGQSAGETQFNFIDEGVEAPGDALIAGALKGSLDALALGRILGMGRRIGKGPIELIKEVGKAAGIEAGTESTQTIIDFLAIKANKGEYDIFTMDNLKELREAAIVGGLLGGGVRTVTGAAEQLSRDNNAPARGESERAPVGDPERPTGPELDPESQGTINAMAETLNDPSSTKDTMEVTHGSPAPAVDIPGAETVETEQGMAITTNPEKAELLRETGGDQATLGTVLYDAPEGKGGTDGSAVVARNAEGTPVAEMASRPESQERDRETMAGQAPEGGTVEVSDAASVLNERAQRRDADALIETHRGRFKQVFDQASRPESFERDRETMTGQTPEGGTVEVSDATSVLNERAQRPDALIQTHRGRFKQVLDQAKAGNADAKSILVRARELRETTDNDQRAMAVAIDEFMSAAEAKRDATRDQAEFDPADEGAAPAELSEFDTEIQELSRERDAREQGIDPDEALEGIEQTDDEFTQQGMAVEEGSRVEPWVPPSRRHTYRNQAEDQVEETRRRNPLAQSTVEGNRTEGYRVVTTEPKAKTRAQAQSKARALQESNPDVFVGFEQLVEGGDFTFYAERLPPQISGSDQVLDNRGNMMSATERTRRGIHEATAKAVGLLRGLSARNSKNRVPESEEAKIAYFNKPDGDPVAMRMPDITTMGMDLNKNNADGSKRTEMQSAYEGFLTGLAALANAGYTQGSENHLSNPEMVFYSKTRQGGFTLADARAESEQRTRPVVDLAQNERRIEKGRKGIREERKKLAPNEPTPDRIERAEIRIKALQAENKKLLEEAKATPRGATDGRFVDNVGEGDASPEVGEFLIPEDLPTADAGRSTRDVPDSTTEGASPPERPFITKATQIENLATDIRATAAYGKKLKAEANKLKGEIARVVQQRVQVSDRHSNTGQFLRYALEDSETGSTRDDPGGPASTRAARIKKMTAEMHALAAQGEKLRVEGRRLEAARADKQMDKQLDQVRGRYRELVNKYRLMTDSETAAINKPGGLTRPHQIRDYENAKQKRGELKYPQNPTTVAEAQATAEQFRRALKGGLDGQLEIIIHSGTSEQYQSSNGLPIERTKAFISEDGRRVHVFAGAHASATDVRRSLMHEVLGHYGMAKLFTPEMQRRIREAIKNSRRQLKEAWEFVDAQYADKTTEVQAEEVLAYVAENLESLEANNSAVARIRRFMVAGLRQAGFLKGKVTKHELHDMLASIARGIREQRPGNKEMRLGQIQARRFWQQGQLDGAVGKVHKLWRAGVGHKIGGILFTASGRLRAISPELAARFYQETNTENTGDAWATAERRAHRKWTGVLHRIIKDMTPEQSHEAFDQLVRELPTEDLSPKARELRQYINRLHKDYLQDRLPTMGFVENYFPRIYDTFLIQKRQAEFRAILEEHGITEEDALAMTQGIIEIQEANVHENRSFMSQTTKVLRQRTLKDPKLIKALVEAGYLNNDPGQSLRSYLNTVTKRAEWESRFGGYERIRHYTPQQEIDKAFDRTRKGLEKQNQTVTTRTALGNAMFPDRELSKRFLEKQQILRARIKADEAVSTEETQQLVREAEEERNAVQKEAHPKDIAETLTKMRDFGHMREDADGYLELYDPNTKLRDIVIDDPNVSQENYAHVKHLIMSIVESAPVDRSSLLYNVIGQIRAYEALRTLAMSGISSIPEIGSIYAGLKQTMGAVEFAKIFKDVALHYKDYEDFAGDIGVMEKDLAVAMQQMMYGPGVGEATRKYDIRKAVPYLLKYNGNDFILNFTKVLSTAAGRQFLLRNANQSVNGTGKEKARAERYLRSIQVTAAQVKVWEKYGFRHPDEIAPYDQADAWAAHAALGRFSEETVTVPSAAERVTWANHPLPSLVVQLKHFVYAFNKKVMLGMAREVANRQREGDSSIGQSTMYLLSAAAMFMFLGAVSDEARQRLLSLGEYGTWYRSYRKPEKMIETWASRSGLDSLPYIDFLKDPSVASAAFAAGPVFSHLHMLFLENIRGDKDALKRLLQSIPITSQFYAMRRLVYERVEEMERQERMEAGASIR